MLLKARAAQRTFFFRDVDGKNKSAAAVIATIVSCSLQQLETRINACFHYGCALRCVAWRGEIYNRDADRVSIVFFSPRNATQRNAQP